MANLRIAKRYAKALFEIAEEMKKLEKITNDVVFIDSLIRSSRELQLFLKSPIIKEDKKREVLKEIFSDSRVDPVTLKFIMLLVEKKREDILHDIVKVYRQIYDEKMGIVSAEVITAVEVGERLKKKIEQKILELTGAKKVKASYRVDPSIIGGIVIRVGDTVYDASIRRRIQLLREQLIYGS
ncbi:F-type H+-transporting ATPase subunit delta [Candidatus Thermokryptus mobilis]|uniref:ATP synthase subunit delta n=1 Tax=Candidatus Thermokryptus mobilis TaxID=1643428 RepID=A0A0S4MSC7_9BACT|nr:ATP synthase F1 subunit delta [Candidatus Thermokryptus mobilis]CUU01419.1 F-type H+-transporting ATPase subunit delta [Candidatus Thermokryptus mobilis]